jgi:hypothetical protein
MRPDESSDSPNSFDILREQPPPPPPVDYIQSIIKDPDFDFEGNLPGDERGGQAPKRPPLQKGEQEG